MDLADIDAMDFSFSCDLCTFSTKDMLEIKQHMYMHRNRGKDPGQMVAALGSNPTTDETQALKDSVLHTMEQDTCGSNQAQAANAQAKIDRCTEKPVTEDRPASILLSTASSTQPDYSNCRNESPLVSVGDEVTAQTSSEGNESKISDEVGGNEESSSILRTTVIVAAGGRSNEANMTPEVQRQGSPNADLSLDSIGDRIHSRRRTTSRKTQQEPEDENDDDYVPYRPARRGFRTTKRHLKSHGVRTRQRLTVPSDRLSCQHCTFVCKFEQSLRAHVRGSHPNVHARRTEAQEKEEDKRETRKKASEEIEQSNPSTDRYKCNLCETTCRFKKDLNEHKNKVHGSQVPSYKYQSRIPENRYQCPECDFACKFQRSLRLHCRSVHPKAVRCPEVRVREKTGKVREDRYQCTNCDFTCKFKGQLKTHKSEFHKKERPLKTLREQQCELCSKFIQGATHHYRRHLMTHTGEKPYKCEICDAVFGDQSRLNAHAPIHLDERNYLCDQCGKSFKRAINLRMHRKVHLVVRPHGCELCDYRCKRHDTLNLHMKRKHLKIRRVLCDTCGKKFFSEKECQLHAARKHLPRPKPFQCKFCPLAFPFAYNLRAHMKKHPDYKPFRCDFCSFESRSKPSLQDHEKQHTGEKQKKCEMCDYTTSTSSNLYKHRKRQHGVVLNRSKSLHASLTGSPQGSISTTPRPHPMLPTHDSQHPHPTLMQGGLHGTPPPIPSRIQATPSPSLTPSVSQSVTLPTTSRDTCIELQNVQAFEEVGYKGQRTLMYAHDKSLIGSVLTEALAEARNVVQSATELYNSHLIPTTVAHPGLHHAVLPVTTTMAPPHGGISAGEAVIHGALPTSAGIPPSGSSTIFNSIMNIHY